jgi:1,4-dihydroxy-2-naphthoate octaprenyltransferase
MSALLMIESLRSTRLLKNQALGDDIKRHRPASFALLTPASASDGLRRVNGVVANHRILAAARPGHPARFVRSPIRGIFPAPDLILPMSSPTPVPVRIAIRPGSLEAWRVAIRARTLWIATVPVFVGTSIAYLASRQVDVLFASLALVAAVLLQAVANLQNDVGYTARGAETGGRVGLPRATSNGWLTPREVRLAIVLAVAAIVLTGLPLVARWGLPVLAMGLASIACALGYMGGPRPIAYTPLGELMVFIFFGLVAVAGSGYVQIGAVTPALVVAGAAIGALAAAVLVVNNHRDIAHDATTGRHTFAVLFGTRASQRLYTMLVLAPFAAVPVLVWLTGSALLWLPMLALPGAVSVVRALPKTPPGLAFNTMLMRTVMLQLIFGAMLTIGTLLAAWL